MNNLSIRNELFNSGMRQWMLADALGISEYTLCKRLRHELPKEEQERIINIIRSQCKS